jgi:ADP-L-glycero-D-manno-heptose 6-epimerase
VALATVNACRALRGERALNLEQLVAGKLIQYVEFPQALVGKYQCRTQADLAALRATGCELEFADVASGVKRYVEWLAASSS